MSFLELSLSYVYAKPKSRVREALFQADRLVGTADSLPFGKRKAILKINLVLLAVFAVFYIYLSGSIVSTNVEKIKKIKDMENISRELERVQAVILSADSGLSLGFFEENGFIESKNLNVIKRINNVASQAEINTYQ